MNKQIEESEIYGAKRVDLLINIKREKGYLPPSYLFKQSISLVQDCQAVVITLLTNIPQ